MRRRRVVRRTAQRTTQRVARRVVRRTVLVGGMVVITAARTSGTKAFETSE
ncbi:MAG: hypothetical protein WBD56_12290 [Anaerolineales bacterium]